MEGREGLLAGQCGGLLAGQHGLLAGQDGGM